MGNEQTSRVQGTPYGPVRTADAVQRPQRQYRWTIRLVVAAVLMAIVAGFVAQNYDLVEARFLFWRTELRLGWALLFSAIAGAVLGFVAGRFRL